MNGPTKDWTKILVGSVQNPTEDEYKDSTCVMKTGLKFDVDLYNFNI